MVALSRLILLTALLSWFVVALGAYVRLSDAGLGCPDWPGCYGRLAAPVSLEHRQAAQAAFPDHPLEVHKAWKEMLHRYSAGTLGLLILAIFFLAWRKRGPLFPYASMLLALVVFQALLGRWTVTELLHPVIVSAHLLGGMATLALVAWIWLSLQPRRAQIAASGVLRAGAIAGLLVVALQIALGGWTSSHYAALACGDTLSCRGSWLPAMDLGQGFSLGAAAASPEALTAIHWSHRLGAVAVVLVLVPLAMALLRRPALRRWGAALLTLLAVQLGLGLANIGLGLPLAAAVLHNAVAALLLVLLVVINRKLATRRLP